MKSNNNGYYFSKQNLFQHLLQILENLQPADSHFSYGQQGFHYCHPWEKGNEKRKKWEEKNNSTKKEVPVWWCSSIVQNTNLTWQTSLVAGLMVLLLLLWLC